MSLAFRIHPDAAQELGDAVEWYNRGGRQRGAEFRADFDRVVDRCLDWPESAAIVPASTSELTFRQAKIPRSHYGVVYYSSEDTLTVVAIAHERRMPLYWSHRA